ncbi:MAG TPA: hypothetical protein VKR52_09965 [Terracidiphilus sp.]|nr:hypothetical protein [Terracidiphilus sp.]
MLGTRVFQTRRPWADSIADSAGIGCALLWGFAEGTLFFIVPDVLISLVALVRPRHAWRHIVMAVAGAAIAGSVLFGWSSQHPENAHKAVARVPLVTPQMFAHVDQSYRSHGLAAVFLGPLSGTPYKIYAVEAPRYLREAVFLSVTVPARAERFVIIWALFALGGFLVRKGFKCSDSQLAAGHVCAWLLIYASYACVMHFR